MYKDFVYFVIFVMKRKNLLLILIPVLLSIWNITLWQWMAWVDPCLWQNLSTCCCPNNWAISSTCQWGGFSDGWACLPWWWNQQWWWTSQWNGNWNANGGGNTNQSWNNNSWWCDPEKVYRIPGWWTGCCPGVLDDNWNCSAWLSDVGINISTDCLLNWQCSLNVYKVLWIRKQDQNPTVLWLFQDITLASTTAILWTVIIVVIIISWLMFAFASITWKDAKRAKSILIDSFIWLLLVMWSYTIIRLIQFLATAWS